MTARTMESAGPGPRPAGRPRSAEADSAILEAAGQVFSAQGFEGLSVGEVAARADVAKTTIYRRYPGGKVDLCMAAARHLCDQQAVEVDTGDVATDLQHLARSLVRTLRTETVGSAVRQMVADAARHPELGAAYRAFTSERRLRVATALAKGRDRGELPREADLELGVDLLVGPIFYRHLVSAQPLDAAYADRVASAVLLALDCRRPD